MNRNASLVQQQVHTAWDAVRTGLQKMYPSSDVRPSSGYDIFEFDHTVGDDDVKFNVRPIVFMLPERAAHSSPSLYVAVKGWLSFEGPDLRSKPLRTRSFGTEVGYFRSKREVVEHVYGAHYDLDEAKTGHPVFHAQISPQMDLLASVNEQFRREWIAQDRVTPILPNVRTPSAQMDVFSVITQLCADHLLTETSSSEVKQAFEKMRTATAFFVGAAHRMEYLNANIAPHCYRSTHWYSGAA